MKRVGIEDGGEKKEKGLRIYENDVFADAT